jgi:hypothetical protein
MDSDRPSLIDSRDESEPERVTDLEREIIFQVLKPIAEEVKRHEGRLDWVECEVEELKRKRSTPVKMEGPMGLSLQGSSKAIMMLFLLASLLYAVLKLH